MIQANYFDLWDLLANELVGDIWILIIIGAILIFLISAKAKMPFQLQMAFLIIWFAMIYVQTAILIIWVFVVLFVGVTFYYTLSRPLNRG